MKNKLSSLGGLLFLAGLLTPLFAQRTTYNFNPDWRVGDKTVTLPYAWNEDEAYACPIAELSDSVVIYEKNFSLPKLKKGARVLVEFEGARQAAEVFVNGRSVVLCEDGISAFGADITDALVPGKEQHIKVVTDNNWEYRERSSNSRYQWNNKNFNVNYGGLTKNVRLHIVPAVHQTLPLIGFMGTTGQYVYAKNIDVEKRTADICVESQVLNSTGQAVTRQLTVVIEDRDGKKVAEFRGDKTTIPAGGRTTLKANSKVGGLHFWSWGYGYLYTVRTIIDGDEVATTTGFRKAEFKNGMIYLNDRVINVHGYAQRSSNEWPGVGTDISPWLADYGNQLCVEGGGNLVRWMHICPSKQEIESCDRVGLIQAMPAGDAEADVTGRRWEQRVEVMRNAIVYNRNNPSILFYECGNKGISRQHMLDMLAVRNELDPHGMRAIGSREMLDIDEAEYGGEMLYVNKSDTKPMWMMEYCRDESLRKYWNAWTPYNTNNGDTPLYHAEGEGPLYRNADASAYNHNSDEFAVEMVRRWYDYWLERPGTSNFVNSGGAKIIFADTQTHCRSEMNYRVSGVVDAMRIPKDAYWTHKVMWDGWVDDIQPRTYICGHWQNVTDTVPVIYVVSNEEEAPELCINGKPTGIVPEQAYRYLYIYRNVPYAEGELLAKGKHSEYALHTAGAPARLRLTAITNPLGWKADGSDVALVEYEVVDKDGNRCPLDNRMVSFTLSGNAEWRGGIAHNKQRTDNMVLSTTLPVESGVNRVMLRSTAEAGQITLTAKAAGLPVESVTLSTQKVDVQGGLAKSLPSAGLKGNLSKGETPASPSFVQSGVDVPIVRVEAGSNEGDCYATIDKNERSTWVSANQASTAWITFHAQESTDMKELVMKMGDWRSKSYPVEVLVDERPVWRGNTPKSLSYIHIPLGNVRGSRITVRMVGNVSVGDGFGAVKELDSRNDDSISRGNTTLRIVEAQIVAPI